MYTIWYILISSAIISISELVCNDHMYSYVQGIRSLVI